MPMAQPQVDRDRASLDTRFDGFYLGSNVDELYKYKGVSNNLKKKKFDDKTITRNDKVINFNDYPHLRFDARNTNKNCLRHEDQCNYNNSTEINFSQ